MERNPKVEATAVGIAYLTAMLENPNGPSPLAGELLKEALAADDEGATLHVGLVNVAVWLLTKLEKATGQSASEVLQDMARRNEQAEW